MAEFQSVCRVDEVAEGAGRTVEISGKLVAVFQHQGQYYAIDDVCPHMGASLSEGYVNNGTVTCPWHAWRFRLADGAWADSPRIKIGSYPVRVLDGQIQIQVDSDPRRTGSAASGCSETGGVSPPCLDKQQTQP